MRHLMILAGLVIAIALGAARFIDGTAKPGTGRSAITNIVSVPSGSSTASAGRMVTLSRDEHGHFQVQARVDGRQVPFMVDTGASAIALRESSAERLGIRVHERDYTIRVSTANGVTKGAPVRLNMVDIDGVVVRDVPAIVQPDDALPVNLLGMTYLSRVRFSYDRGRLVLEQ